jgi:hypothetical protein
MTLKIGASRHSYLHFISSKMVLPPVQQAPELRSSYIKKMNRILDIQIRKQILLNALALALQPQPQPQQGP